MRLRNLEIQGFKSFPDKTKLDFNDGITAVVGPNGSGKSNIADAVRWVLGEQSSKTLRGGKMEDVIFGGTQQRKAQGFSQVQLSIDNADRALACDSDLVCILRKLYRSGESEYRINGASVRLKDIHELLMDTGLGRDGYSIIGQGKIAEIVGAKSNERREIFEEAAGISKYQYRKAEAQRRLEAAEENLLRLKDILIELEDRVEPLRIQAEKAKKYLDFSGEKKVLEISLWVDVLERSRALLRGQEDKILLFRTQYEEIQEEFDTSEQAIAAKGEGMRRLAVEMDESSAQIRALEEKAAEHSRQIAVLENDLVHNEETITRVQSELAQTNLSGGELAFRIDEQRQDITKKEQEIATISCEKAELQNQLNELNKQRNDSVLRIDTLKDQRFTLTQSINEAKLTSASSTSLIDETQERLNTIRDGADVKNENVNRLEKEITDCTELLESIGENIASLQNGRSGYMLKHTGRKEKLDKLMQERQSLEDEARQHLQRAKLLFDMENSMEGFQNSVKFVMNKVNSGALNGVFGPVSRLIDADEQYALAIEIALGAAMQNIAVVDETVAKRAIGMLKDARSGRATFLPLSTVNGKRLSEPWLAGMDGFVGIAAELVRFDEKFTGMIDQLLGRIVIVQDLDCATAVARRGNYRFRVVTLDGQVVNAGGSMTGGYAARSAGILSRSSEIDGLKKKAALLDGEIAALDEKVKSVREELAQTEAALSGIDGEIATAQEDRIRYEAELKQLHNAQADAIRVREQVAEEHEKLSERLEELRRQNVSSSDLIMQMEQQLEDVSRLLTVEYEGRDALSEKSREISDQMAEQSMASMALSRDIDGMQRMMEQLDSQRADQTKHREELERQVSECSQKAVQVRAQLESSAQAQTQCTGEVAALEVKISALRKARVSSEGEATTLRENQKEIITRRDQMGRELARFEEKKATLQVEYDQTISRLWEEYEVAPSEAIEIAQPIEDVPIAQRRLTELKNAIRALGSVNTAAVEEYQEVSQRYTFMKTQTDDAQRSKDELQLLIQQLTEEMQRIFLDNFHRIATHFSSIFRELFGGGSASLTLTDPSDVLQSGIEIHVQPPGKLIGNLSVLSGGEQALVAIAIYFAILKVKPSPFVLLDEIEAALDDVNVVKYAQYLRTICGKTQFIAITHRRGTMEEADVLYGVTMQEKGVSKLLTLNVSELESKLGMK